MGKGSERIVITFYPFAYWCVFLEFMKCLAQTIWIEAFRWDDLKCAYFQSFHRIVCKWKMPVNWTMRMKQTIKTYNERKYSIWKWWMLINSRFRRTVCLTNGKWHAIEFITQNCIENVNVEKKENTHTCVNIKRKKIYQTCWMKVESFDYSQKYLTSLSPPKSMCERKNEVSAQYRNYLFKLSSIRTQLWLYGCVYDY